MKTLTVSGIRYQLRGAKLVFVRVGTAEDLSWITGDAEVALLALA